LNHPQAARLAVQRFVAKMRKERDIPMSSSSDLAGASMRFTRLTAIAALMSAPVLAGSPAVAGVDSATNALIQLAQSAAPQSKGAKEATGMQAETVEQRIANLRTALKITQDEDVKWNSVAQAMRENAAAMQKLAAEKTAKDPQTLTAVQDLRAYEKFAQAHVDGLKNLISSFETLYASMPDPQKKLADQVFQSYGRDSAPSHS
jgi:hypothetical protein